MRDWEGLNRLMTGQTDGQAADVVCGAALGGYYSACIDAVQEGFTGFLGKLVPFHRACLLPVVP